MKDRSKNRLRARYKDLYLECNRIGDVQLHPIQLGSVLSKDGTFQYHGSRYYDGVRFVFSSRKVAR